MEPIVIWNRRESKLVMAAVGTFGSGFMVFAAYPSEQGIVWATIATGCAFFLFVVLWWPLWEADRIVVRICESGVWIENLTAMPIRWHDVRDVNLGYTPELIRAICFDLHEGPARDELVSKRRPKKMKLMYRTCDLYFAVPLGIDAGHILNSVLDFMAAARSNRLVQPTPIGAVDRGR